MDPSSIGRFVAFLWGLIPQKDDDALQLYTWRWKSVALGVATLGVALYAANWFPFLSPPYALAEGVRIDRGEIQQKFDSTSRKLDDLSGKVVVVLAQQHDAQVHQVTNDLIDARRYQCRAINSSDEAAKPFWNGRISALKLQYQQLTGDNWADQDCRSF